MFDVATSLIIRGFVSGCGCGCVALALMVAWSAFAKGEYKPEILFDDSEILSRIAEHPMARWKCSRKTTE